MTIKVGDFVGFKYDIEQTGKVEEISRRYGRLIYHVRAFRGEYVNSQEGTIVELYEEDLF